MIYHKIISVKYPDKALGAKVYNLHDTRVDLSHLDDPTALWQVSFHPLNKWNVGFTFENRASGWRMSTVQGANLGSPVNVFRDPYDQEFRKSVWQTTVADNMNAERAIFPLMDDGLCISIRAEYGGKLEVRLLSDSSERESWWRFQPVSI